MLYFVLLHQDMDFGFEKFWVVSMFIAEKTSDLTGSMVCGMNWSHQSSVDNCNLFLRLQYVINDRQNMDASENIMIIAMVFVSYLKTILPIFWFLIRRVPWVGRDCLTWLYAFKYCLLMSLIQRRENTVSSLLSEVLMVLCFSVECQQTSVQTL